MYCVWQPILTHAYVDAYKTLPCCRPKSYQADNHGLCFAAFSELVNSRVLVAKSNILLFSVGLMQHSIADSFIDEVGKTKVQKVAIPRRCHLLHYSAFSY